MPHQPMDNSPPIEIPKLYQDVINSEMAAMEDKELHSQMVAFGNPDIGFAHGTAASLYNGRFCGTAEINQATSLSSLYTKTTHFWKPKPCATSA
jgi:hypothetical protein